MRAHLVVTAALLGGLLGGVATQGAAQSDSSEKAKFEVYGFVQGDFIFDFKQNDPAWFDVVRPTKLPASPDQFGRDGHFYASVRQTRFGVRTFIPTGVGQLKTTFEFDLFGVGASAGQTTLRPRIFYGELGHFGAGQYYSPFMDIDVFPNTLEYWGPNGMLFFRNIQVRWMPIQGDTRLTFALEQPGATGDGGVFANRVELTNVQGRFPAPDFSMEYRQATPWGYVEIAGMLRYLKLDDNDPAPPDLNRSFFGGGGSLSSNVKFGKSDVLKLQVVYGAGIQNYFNDAPVDVAPEINTANAASPVFAKAVPILGLVAFLDHTWNDHFTSSIGYSRVNIYNTNGQTPSDFHIGQYGAANLLYLPIKDVVVGGEFLWGRRENFTDGFAVNDFRFQFSARYAFSKTF